MNIKDCGHDTIRVDLPLPAGKTATLYLIETEQLDLLCWQLSKLGLDIMPHSSGPDYGWGYVWRAAATGWEGPYESRKEAIDAAFVRAAAAIIALRQAPFPLQIGDAFRWTGQDWEAIHKGDETNHADIAHL